MHFDKKTGLVYINKKDVSLKDNDLTVKTLRVLGENKTGKINLAVNSFNSEINSITNRTEKLSVLAGNFSVQIADAKANTNVNKIHVYLNESRTGRIPGHSAHDQPLPGELPQRACFRDG